MKKIIITSLAALLSTTVNADNSQVEKVFKERFPFAISAIEDSPIPAVKQIVTQKGVFYMTEDGQHFIQGSVFKIGERFTNLTEARYKPMKEEALQSIKPYMKTFKASEEKAQIYVFTDVTCGYCGKLHSELDDYLAKGITVNYVSFPRGGMTGNGFELNQTAWCSDTPRETMSELFNRQSVTNKVCDANIDKMYQVGEMFKINGTPAIVTEDMQVIPGYMPAQQMAKQLGLG
ncbi:thioredoxin fold domain-containing protein [Pseudoalteromonas sp. T1lg23B]|uniref:thioredoxin fold domain-containing protein n=1 Tax=Pseudoalteromonas sp. T1lg23B TaxID=2077097 RepID=UPI000CF63BC3|nr:thioredoxin fold domain-containing protein [Pseudoalteromonas sp. T1lg23B]